MTILHHAVNGDTDERALAASAGPPPIRGGESLPPVTEGDGAAEAPPAADQRQMFSLDQRLPVIHSVLAFAKAKLWMPEVCMFTHPRRASRHAGYMQRDEYWLFGLDFHQFLFSSGGFGFAQIRYLLLGPCLCVC